VTVLVLAKKSKAAPAIARQAAMAILLAVSMMYVRLLALVVIFRPDSSAAVGPALALFAGLAATYVLWLRRGGGGEEGPAAQPAGGGQNGGVAEEPALRRNPLELNAAVLFAVLFTAVSLATKYVVVYFRDVGLHLLSFVVGFSDITPFVVSLLQGNFGIDERQVVQATIIAAASNNLLKLVYTYVFGSRRTARLVAPGMIVLVLVSVLYVLIGV
jgi:uncharacterized membrane protein (DUF4010 family)